MTPTKAVEKPQVLFFCDGCGASEPGEFYRGVEAHKPRHWFARCDDETGPMFACSRACIDRAAKSKGTHAVVLPI